MSASIDSQTRLSLVKLFGLARLASDEGRLEEAERLYRIVMRDGPLPEVARNLFVVLDRQGRHAEAEQLLREARARWPEDRPTALFLGMALLSRGAYAEGWPLYHHQDSRERWRGGLSFPEWKGEPVRSLLVLPDQGLGDQIMFARFAAILAGRGVAVTFYCRPPLVRLFAGLGVRVLPADGPAEIARHEAWTIASALPWRMGVGLEDVPGAPYLPSKPGGQGIGVAVRGNPAHTRDQWRSLPEPLQREVLAWPGVRSLHPEDTGAADFEDTRRIIEDLELVITVDTAVAHLAGAMGKPVWLMVASPADWRWLRERSDSPWYPSVRIFRQPGVSDWGGMLAQVKAELDKRASRT